MKKPDLNKMIQFEIGRYGLYIAETQITEALNEAKESIEPLGELDAYSASVTTAHTYALPSTVYYVEGVFVEPSSGGGNTKQLPPSLWAFDHVDLTLTLLQTPSTSDTLWVVFRNKYDWSTPTWVPSTHTMTNTISLPFTSSGQTFSGLAQQITVSASCSVYAVKVNLGTTVNPADCKGYDGTITLFSGGATTPGTSTISLAQSNFNLMDLSLGCEDYIVDFSNPITFWPSTYYWLKVDAGWNTATSNTALNLWWTIRDDTATATHGYAANYNTLGTWAVGSPCYPWQYKTVVETIEVDPEYVRQYASYLLYSQLAVRFGKKDLANVADNYYQKATLRKDYLFRRKNLESVIEERRQLKLGG